MPLEKGTYYKLVCGVHGADGFAGDEIQWRVCEGRVEPDGRVLCSCCIEDEEIAAANREADEDEAPSATTTQED